jgi:integrase
MRGHIRSYELKKGQKQWAIVLFLGKQSTGKRKYRWIRGFKTRREADTEMRRILRSMDEGTYIEPSKETLGAYLDRWLATYAKANVAGKTYERYEQIIEKDIKPSIGSIVLTKLTPVNIAEFYTYALTNGRKRKDGGLSQRTVLHFHRLLREALQQAVIWQLRPTNPADAVEPPRPVDVEMQAVDEDRGAWLIQTVIGTRFYVPVVYGLCTGLRRGEILAQRWQDIDFETQSLLVSQALEQTRKGGLKFKIPKNRKRRRITMPPLLIEALVAHREEQDKNRQLFGSDYKTDLDLIVALPDGSPWKPDSFTASYARFAAKIGLKGIRFHGLRHSHASHMLRQRIPLKTVQQRLGHANASVTLNTYAHMLPGDDEEAAELIDKRLREAIKKQSETRPN